MKNRRNSVLAGALALACVTAGTAAVSAASAAPARSAPGAHRASAGRGVSVSVRVEGLNRTLLAAKTVRTHASGWITKGHTPARACSAKRAAGALDVATHHRWAGTYSSGLGIEVTSVLGERHVYSAHGYYWGIWVDNRFASSGICGLKLHRGEQLLFAPAPGTGSDYPIVISAPAHVTAGVPFVVKASYFAGATGPATPLAGVSITDAAGATDATGSATVTIPHSGSTKLTATLAGYIRAEATVAAS